MLGTRKRMRTVEEERRVRMVETLALAIVMVITLFLIYKAMTTV